MSRLKRFLLITAALLCIGSQSVAHDYLPPYAYVGGYNWTYYSEVINGNHVWPAGYYRFANGYWWIYGKSTPELGFVIIAVPVRPKLIDTVKSTSRPQITKEELRELIRDVNQ